MSENNGTAVLETVCGVDEAGAGPLMGPVYAAAVILPRELDIPGLNDSKKLTEKKREALLRSHHRSGRRMERGPGGGGGDRRDGHPQRPDAGHAAGH